MEQLYRRSDFTDVFSRALLDEHGTALAAAKAIREFCVNDNGDSPAVHTITEWIRAGVVRDIDESPRGQVIYLDGVAIDKALAEEILAEYGNPSWAARAIANRCTTAHRHKRSAPSVNSVRFYLSRVAAGRHIPGYAMAEPSSDANRIQELLDKAGIKPESIGGIKGVRVKSWGYAMKGPDGLPVEGGLHATDITLTPKPEYPLITQAPPITVSFTDVPRIMRRLRTFFVVSDTQIGFLKGPQGLETIHDLDAIDVTKQLIAATQPDELVCIGDFIDATSISKWPQHPEFDGTLQPSIDAASRILGEMIAAAGKGVKATVVSGNHDVRFERFALQNAKAFMGLRRADAAPGEWPVLSMPFLLRFDDLGVNYTGHFPAGGYWLADNFLAIHEPQRKLDYSAHIVHGHDHRLTQEAYAQHSRYGRESFFQYSVGCLCKVGSRTTDPSSLVLTQTPSDRARTSWSQGNGIVEILDGKIPQHNFEHVFIREGVALYRGEVFEATRETAEAVA